MCLSLISVMILLIYKFCLTFCEMNRCESMFMISHKTYFCYTETVISTLRTLCNMMLFLSHCTVICNCHHDTFKVHTLSLKNT